MEDIMNEEMLLTQDGYDKIVAEYDELVSVKRAEVAERIKKPSHTVTFRRTLSTIQPKTSRPNWKRESDPSKR